MSLLHLVSLHNFSSETDGLLAEILLLLFLPLLIVLFVYAVPQVIINYKLFQKAGKRGSSAIVPLYNIYVLGQIAQKEKLAIGAAIALPLIYVPIVQIGAVLAYLPLIILIFMNFIPKYRGNTTFWVTYFLLPIVAVFLVKDVEYISPAAATPLAGAVPPQQPVAPTAPVQPMVEVPVAPAVPPQPVTEPTQQVPPQPPAGPILQ